MELQNDIFEYPTDFVKDNIDKIENKIIHHVWYYGENHIDLIWKGELENEYFIIQKTLGSLFVGVSERESTLYSNTVWYGQFIVPDSIKTSISETSNETSQLETLFSKFEQYTNYCQSKVSFDTILNFLKWKLAPGVQVQQFIV